MEQKILTQKLIENFVKWLRHEEKSNATVEKYLRDVTAFSRFAANTDISKETVICYKNQLVENGYAARSINSMLAALCSLFDFLGWYDCKVKTLKIAHRVCLPEEKELTRAEYVRLVNAAKESGNKRLHLILQTVCGTGIRVSELKFITAGAVKDGRFTVCCKGKTRTVYIVAALKQKLLRYISEQHIVNGSVFVTKTGKPVDRTNIWREMKKLCEKADVDPKKVFPHNLRHLFARTFYGIEKDIAYLADILGHSNINTTRIYTVTSSKEHRRRMENMHLII